MDFEEREEAVNAARRVLNKTIPGVAKEKREKLAEDVVSAVWDDIIRGLNRNGWIFSTTARQQSAEYVLSWKQGHEGDEVECDTCIVIGKIADGFLGFLTEEEEAAE